jgi:hypothetical protein
MRARPGGNALPDTGIGADFAPTAHSDFARQTCNKATGNREETGLPCLAAQRVLPLF